jgi:hypothetical protein
MSCQWPNGWKKVERKNAENKNLKNENVTNVENEIVFKYKSPSPSSLHVHLHLSFLVSIFFLSAFSDHTLKWLNHVTMMLRNE